MSRWPRYQMTATKNGVKVKPAISEDVIQAQVITWAKRQGKVEICRSFDEARDVLLSYLSPKVPYSTEIY